MNPEKSPAECCGCYHMIYNQEGMQTGCELKLLDKLESYSEEGKNHFLLNKICLFKNKSDHDVDVKLGYIFILHKDVEMQNLIDNILAVKEYNPAWIGVSTYTTDNHEVLKTILNTMNCKYNIVMNYKDLDDFYKLDQFIDLFHNGWTSVNIVGEPLSLPKEKLQKFIFNGGRAALIKNTLDENDLQINGIIYFNFIYKMLNGNLPEKAEDEELFISKSFAHKIVEKDPKMLVRLGDI